MSRRRAFSLVEVSVFMGVGLLLSAGIWSMLRWSVQRSRKTDAKLQGVQADVLLAHQLERDLAALHEGPEVPLRIESSPAGAVLEFERFGPADVDPGTAPIPRVRVRYLFDRAAARVTRQVGAGTPVPFHGAFERVEFRRVDPREPGPDGLLPEAPAVVFSIVAAPAAVLDLPPEGRKARDRTVVVGGAPRRERAAEVAWPYWNAVTAGRAP